MAKLGAVFVAKNAMNRREAFSCELHESHSPAEHRIEAAFYQKHRSEGVPEGTHFELEILEPADLTAIEYVSAHIHTNPDTQRHFICWTGQIATAEQAMQVFLNWAAGMTYSLVYKQDFMELFMEHRDDWIEYLGTTYRIYLEWKTG